MYALPAFLAAGAAVTAADHLAIPGAAVYGARKFYKAANRADWKKAKMNDLYGYAKGSQKSSGTKRGRSMSRGSSRSRSRSRGSHVYSGGIGHYQGKLPAPKRPKRPSKYEKAGFTAEVERFGTQTLNDVCYVGCTSLCHEDIGDVVGIAFIRKIMKRHYQFEYTSPEQLINPRVPATPAAYGVGPIAILFYYEEITAADAEPTIVLGYTYTLGLTSLSAFATAFYTNVLASNTFGQVQAGTNYPLRRLHGYQFQEADYLVAEGLGAVQERYSPLYPLKNQYLTVYSAVTMGIQNITSADDGSLLTTHVDANPVKGKLFHFKDLLPRLQQRNGAFGTVTTDNSFKLQIDPNSDGIIKPDSSLSGGFAQIPTASMFSNCNGEAPISLEPGHIKDYKLIFKFNGTLEKFMNGFSAFNYPLQKGAFGTCCLFALEKRMPTGGAPVSVNFHYESRFGCVFGKRLGALMPKGGSAGTAVTAE